VRKLIFLLAFLLALLLVAVETERLPARTVAGWLAPHFAPSQDGPPALPTGFLSPEQQEELDELQEDRADELDEFDADVTGMGIPALGYLDGLLLYSLALIGVGYLVPARIVGRVQGVLTLIVSIVTIVLAILAILLALVKLLTMVALLLSIPFGTLIYLVVYGSFPKGDVLAVLSLLFALKLLVGLALVAAHQRYLENKGLVLLIGTTLLVNVVISFLFGLLPGILASIVDAVAAIVAAVVAIVWALILAIGAIVAIVAAIKSLVPRVPASLPQ
jgi:hypothetical protein